MTPRQKQTLYFIRDHWEEHGHAPSYEEIRKGINAKSKSSVAAIIRKLEERGYIERIPNAARSIRLLHAPLPDTADVPASPSQDDMPYA